MDILELNEDAPMPERDRKARANAENGNKGGIAKGTELANKRTYPRDKLIDATADAILAGKRSPLTLPRVGAVTDHDKRTIARITESSAEEFSNELTLTLRTIARATGQRIMEKLEEGNQKLSDLNMTLAIAVDKHAAVSGRSAQSGNVSVTVNNYGAMSREQILASLHKEERNVTPIV